MIRATVQNPDIFFQLREASNAEYAALPDIVEDYFAKISAVTGREYHLFNYYGAPDATDVVIAMGSVSGAAREAVDYLNARGRKCGFVQVHLFRPFSPDYLFKALPASVQRIAVLDRCKEMGSAGEPLYQDVCTACASTGWMVRILGGRYGLSSKDTDAAQLVAVYENLASDRIWTVFLFAPTVPSPPRPQNLQQKAGSPRPSWRVTGRERWVTSSSIPMVKLRIGSSAARFSNTATSWSASVSLEDRP